MKSEKSLKLICLVLLVVLIILIAYVVFNKQSKDDFIVNDGKEGYEVEVVDKVPGIVYDNSFYYNKGYSIVENDGAYYIYITLGEKKTDDNKVEAQKIVIENKSIDITLKGDASGESRLLDDKKGAISMGIKLNKAPEKITVKGLSGENLNKIEYMNIPQIVLSGLNNGSLECLKYMENFLEKYDLDLSIEYNENTYDGLFGISSFLEEIDLTKTYNIAIGTNDEGKNIINVSDME